MWIIPGKTSKVMVPASAYMREIQQGRIRRFVNEAVPVRSGKNTQNNVHDTNLVGKTLCVNGEIIFRTRVIHNFITVQFV